MNLQQLRIIQETVKNNYNLTEVGNTLATSQPGISKHIKDLEDELGVELFVRRGKRFLGLTDPGKALLFIIERILLDIKNINLLAEQYKDSNEGQLRIVTTHNQACYVLPPLVAEFKKTFPKVHLSIKQESPKEIKQLLLEGKADIAIATEGLKDIPEFLTFPYFSWNHIVTVPHKHPLIQKEKITLDDLAEYPIITYQEGVTGRNVIDDAFTKANLSPDIIMSALDSNVIKTYVELGLGIGIIASMAYNPTKDQSLVSLKSDHLFKENTAKIAIRKGLYLRNYVHTFIKLCVKDFDEKIIQKDLEVF